MYDRNILQELQAATIAAVAASTMPALPVKYLGIGEVPPNDQKWLEIVHIPNNPANGYWGNEQDYQGLYRLILHWPNRGEGAYGPMDVLASVCSYFVKGLLLPTVKISDNPTFMGVTEHGAELLFPVSVRYQCFRS